MGCDIHAFLEYKPAGVTNWLPHPVSIKLARDYALFASLAGVRAWDGCESVAARRGMPKDAHRSTQVENWLWVGLDRGDGRVPRDLAEAWVSKGTATLIEDGRYITNPDFHSHSWCTLEDLRKAVESLDEDEWRHLDDSYGYLISVMTLTEYNKNACRLVFWFDS